MKRRKLGRQGLEVSAIGLGCMGMSHGYSLSTGADARRTLDRALELGIDFWDTAEVYGPFRNEELLGEAMVGRRDLVTLATKFAWQFDGNGKQVALDGSPQNVRRAVEGSLRRLRTDYIDLLYQHRLDPVTPIEETVGAMGALVTEGKVRFIGLSEVGPSTIRRAHAIHPVSAVQSEYSLWQTELDERVLPTMRELGIGLVAFSPVGRGFLTGQVRHFTDFGEDDIRRRLPRFQGENFVHNLRLVDAVEKIAKSYEVTPAQVALAWLLRRGLDIVPIPGTTRVSHLEENAAAAELTLPDSAWRDIDAVLRQFTPAGARYSDAMMQTIDRS